MLREVLFKNIFALFLYHILVNLVRMICTIALEFSYYWKSMLLQRDYNAAAYKKTFLIVMFSVKLLLRIDTVRVEIEIPGWYYLMASIALIDRWFHTSGTRHRLIQFWKGRK